MEEVWSDAYSARTRIPAKTLVSRLTISAYSFSLVITIMIKAASNKIQSTEKHNRMTPFFVFALPSSVSCFIKPPLSALNGNFLLCVSLTEYSCCVIKSTIIVYTTNSGALTWWFLVHCNKKWNKKKALEAATSRAFDFFVINTLILFCLRALYHMRFFFAIYSVYF